MSKEFYLVCKRMKITPQILFEERLNAALHERLDQPFYNYVTYMMEFYRFYLSGGFLLAILNGDNLNDCRDLDFYLSTGVPIRVVELKSSVDRDYSCDRHIVSVRNVVSEKGYPIQFVRFVDEPPFDYFDFDFCKNTYSGGHLIIRNVQSVYTKRCVVNIDQSYIVDKEICDINHNYVIKCQDRIEKYRARGYSIETRGYGSFEFLANCLGYANPSDEMASIQLDILNLYKKWRGYWTPSILPPNAICGSNTWNDAEKNLQKKKLKPN